MKLRNKKSGKIKSIEQIIRDAFLYDELDSLKNIDANWEEIEPKEPLIKDEKIRKAIRAWSEANGTSTLTYDGLYILTDEQVNDIEFGESAPFDGLEKGKEYTIEELCGSEECES